MNKLIESKAFPWIAAVLVGALMGFVLGPLMTSWLMHQTLTIAFQLATAVISGGIVGLVIENALASRPYAVAADRKDGKVDKIFGVGRVIYVVEPHPESGRLQFTITTHGVSRKRFQDVLLPLLSEVEGIEWGTPVEPTAYAKRQALRAYVQSNDLVEDGEKQPATTIALHRGISGTVKADASFLRVVETVEAVLGSPQPL